MESHEPRTTADSEIVEVFERPPFATTSTKELLHFGLYHVEQRRRLVEIIVRALDACAGKQLYDGYLVDLLSQSLEGAVVQVCSAAEWTQELLGQIKAGRFKDFARPGHPRGRLSPKEQAALAEARDSFRFLFPDAVARKAGRPNAGDVTKIEEIVRGVVEPLRTHRNRIVGHWDAKPQRRATWGELVDPLRVLVSLFGHLWLVHTGVPYQVPTLSPHSRESTSALPADAILREPPAPSGEGT